jgi:carbonic anhydrase
MAMSEANAKPIVKFKTKAEHYVADACIVWCSDDRFYKLLKKFGKKQKFKNLDLVKIAGGAKALATPIDEPSAERDFVLNQLMTAVRLHGAKRIILMLHRDCGAYGGSENFINEYEEHTKLLGDLRIAREFVKKEMPALLVDAYLADFNGLYLAE